MKAFCYVRLPYEEVVCEQTQIQAATTLAEELGYKIVQNNGTSQMEKFLANVSIMPKVVLQGTVLIFRE